MTHQEIIMTQYEKGISVMNFLQNLGIDMITISAAVDDRNLAESYRKIKSNPKMTKKEALAMLLEMDDRIREE